MSDATYSSISHEIDEWFETHEDESFNLDTVCRQLNIVHTQTRRWASQKLNNEVKAKVLKKSNSIYTFINNRVETIDWLNAEEEDILPIIWPHEHSETGAQFGFDGRVQIHKGETVVIAGVSNTGKTGFAMNLLADNMDYFPCTYMSSETTGAKFKERIYEMDWCMPTNGDNKPKFELLFRDGDWEDIIRPDSINIIDWIDVGDEFWKIGNVIAKIQRKLRNGIAVILIQKNSGKDWGEGGERSVRLASFYLTMDYNQINCKKAKSWTDWNPNFKSWGYKLYNKGTAFTDIRLLERCYKCYGNGFTRMGKCQSCSGTGYIDAEEL